jgi:hypothetical protein
MDRIRCEPVHNALGLRSVITTPHRSNTAFNLFNPISRSVVPEDDPIVMMASLTESWITRDYGDHVWH